MERNIDYFDKAYIGKRGDLLKLIPEKVNKILDVGCSIGELGLSIKKKLNVKIHGIEISRDMAIVAKSRLDKVYIGDVESIFKKRILRNNKYDLIIFADILEHLNDPWTVMKQATKYLSENGYIVASIPNVKHISTLYNLIIKSYWPYRERGIHDKNHLRFFTRKNIFELFNKAGLQIDVIKSNYRILEPLHEFNRYAKYFAIPGFRSILTFQYLVRARKYNSNDDTLITA